MKLYMIRHGQSTANLKRELSTPSTPLTEAGMQDARCAGKILSGYRFDRVFVSPYLRARETQAIALPGVDGEIMPLIREFDCGRIEGEKYADVLDQYGDAFREILEVDDFRSFGGENYEDVRERVRAFMAFAESLNCEKIAAFSHAGYILTFFDEVMHRDGKPGRNIRCDNGSVNVFECIEGEWKVSAFNVTETL